jgi:NSS family neurotransmitter:Na+ symporter
MASGSPVGDLFRSRWGLVLATLGAAIGTGNIWRFPKEAAVNGGGAFMIAYLIFLFTWSIPLVMTGFAIGKRARLGPIGSFGVFAGKKHMWMGAWVVFLTVAISCYYAVVMGWVIRYTMYSATGGFSGTTLAETAGIWNSFMSSPAELVFFHITAVLISAFVVYRGIRRGIERVAIFLLPVLFGILILTAIWALAQPGAVNGLGYLFVPNMEYLGRGETWIRALAQSAWSSGAGMGVAITYGMYMRRKEDTNLNAFLAGLGDTGASLLAGIAVICTIFALSASASAANQSLEMSGAELTFVQMTALFGTMPGGSAVAFIFFFGMAIAALTSMIAMMEVSVRSFMDFGWSRPRAVRFLAVVVFLCGLPSALIVMSVSGTETPVFLDNQDHIWGLALIINGFFIAYFAVRKFGIERFRSELLNSRWNDIHIGKWWDYVVRYLIPLQFVVLLLWFSFDTLTQEPSTWWRSGPAGLAIMLIVWGVVLLILYMYNDWFVKKFRYRPAKIRDDDEAVDAIVVDERV